jgi:hypothetical protein
MQKTHSNQKEWIKYFTIKSEFTKNALYSLISFLLQNCFFFRKTRGFANMEAKETQNYTIPSNIGHEAEWLISQNGPSIVS